MLPASKTSTAEWKNFKVFFDTQYPNTEDCATLNKHIADINSDLILLAALKIKKEGYAQAVREWFDNCVNYLKILLKAKENTYKFSCANYSATNTSVSNLDQNIGNVPTTTATNPQSNVAPTTENNPNAAQPQLSNLGPVTSLGSKLNMTYVYIGFGVIVVAGFIAYRLKK